jgi:hypothetical protein
MAGRILYMDDILRFNGVHLHKHAYSTHTQTQTRYVIYSPHPPFLVPRLGVQHAWKPLRLWRCSTQYTFLSNYTHIDLFQSSIQLFPNELKLSAYHAEWICLVGLKSHKWNITSWKRVLRQKLLVIQLVNIFRTFYETRSFISILNTIPWLSKH